METPSPELNSVNNDNSSFSNPSSQPLSPVYDVHNTSVSKKLKIAYIVIFLLVLTCLAGGFFWMKTNGLLNVNSIKTADTKINIPDKPNITPVAEPSKPVQTTKTVPGIDVDWFDTPQRVASIGFFAMEDQKFPFKVAYCVDDTGCYENGKQYAPDKLEPSTIYYWVGNMKTEHKGAAVYLTINKKVLHGPMMKGGLGKLSDLTKNDVLLGVIIKDGDNFIIPNDYDNRTLLCGPDCAYGDDSDLIKRLPTNVQYVSDMSLDPVGSSFNSENKLPTTNLSVNRVNELFIATGQYLVKDYGNGYVLYSNQDSKNKNLKAKTTVTPTLTVKLPTGVTASANDYVYGSSLVYKFGTYTLDSNAQMINWSGSSKPQELKAQPDNNYTSGDTDYTEIGYNTDFDGCSENFKLKDLPDNEIINIDSDLEKVATTSNGQPVYEIKKDLKIFKMFYDSKVVKRGLKNKLSYNEYLELKPILLWKTPYGVYRMVFRNDLVSSKCWGEPLIYLYPTAKTDVSVKLNLNISLVESEPAYKTGWNVTAYPGGKIVNRADSREYQSLYWEGSAPELKNPVMHAVLAKDDVHNYLESVLPKLGLNPKEISDFEKFWEPQLNTKPYYLISFYDAQSMNAIAPMNINPKPETIIRVLMEYRELEKSVNVETLPEYQTPVRNGFTVVEWGGILHNPDAKFSMFK